MTQTWRIILLALLLLAGSVGTAAAQGKPDKPGGGDGGGPGTGETCPTGTAQVVLDPGHGGSDPGAVNAEYNLVEKDLNLEIAQLTASSLPYTVALTRYDDRNLENSQRGVIANA